MSRLLAVVALVGVAVASARPADACMWSYGTNQPVNAALIRERRAYLDTVPPYRTLFDRVLDKVVFAYALAHVVAVVALVVRFRRRRRAATIAR